MLKVIENYRKYMNIYYISDKVDINLTVAFTRSTLINSMIFKQKFVIIVNCNFHLKNNLQKTM